jgi:hypothetical protein
MFNILKPYVLRCIIRRNLPDPIYDILVNNLGLFNKGHDCEAVCGSHSFYNCDGQNYGCYYCEIKKTFSPLKTIILILPLSNTKLLDPFVEQCLIDKVSLICVFGDNCQDVEDKIDWILVGDGSDENRFITTTSHPNDTLEDVKKFAQGWSLDHMFYNHTPDVEEIKL